MGPKTSERDLLPPVAYDIMAMIQNSANCYWEEATNSVGSPLHPPSALVIFTQMWQSKLLINQCEANKYINTPVATWLFCCTFTYSTSWGANKFPGAKFGNMRLARWFRLSVHPLGMHF